MPNDNLFIFFGVDLSYFFYTWSATLKKLPKVVFFNVADHVLKYKRSLGEF